MRVVLANIFATEYHGLWVFGYLVIFALTRLADEDSKVRMIVGFPITLFMYLADQVIPNFVLRKFLPSAHELFSKIAPRSYSRLGWVWYRCVKVFQGEWQSLQKKKLNRQMQERRRNNPLYNEQFELLGKLNLRIQKLRSIWNAQKTVNRTSAGSKMLNFALEDIEAEYIRCFEKLISISHYSPDSKAVQGWAERVKKLALDVEDFESSLKSFHSHPFHGKVVPQKSASPQSSYLSENLYTRLGLTISASPKDVKRAYYALAKKLHPDTETGKTRDSKEAFIHVNEAYEILSSPEKRARYELLYAQHGPKWIQFKRQLK